MVRKKKLDSDEYQSETGNWNIADNYAFFKIFKHIKESDDYETIARFGYAELIDELNNNLDTDYLKLKGFERLVNSLIMLCNNTIFAIKGKGNLENLNEYLKDLLTIRDLIPKLFKRSHDQVKNTTKIKLIQDKYTIALNKVVELKAKINKPLNSSHLIFIEREVFDPEEYMKKLEHRAINFG